MVWVAGLNIDLSAGIICHFPKVSPLQWLQIGRSPRDFPVFFTVVEVPFTPRKVPESSQSSVTYRKGLTIESYVDHTVSRPKSHVQGLDVD